MNWHIWANLICFMFCLPGWRHQAGLLQDRQHRRHAWQHPGFQTLSSWQRGVRVALWGHVQRAEQHHLSHHRRRLWRRGHWRRQVHLQIICLGVEDSCSVEACCETICLQMFAWFIPAPQKLIVLLFCCSLSRYPGSTFMDHVLRYQDTPGIKMIVVLGEVKTTL